MLDLDLVRDVVKYYNSNESTVRKTAKVFGISKSSVHRYLTRVFPNKKSAEILQKNKIEAPYRGGKASEEKFKEKRS